MKSLGNLGGVVGQGAAGGSRAQGLLDFEFFLLGAQGAGQSAKTDKSLTHWLSNALVLETAQ